MMKIIEICSDVNSIDGGEGTYAKRLIYELRQNPEVNDIIVKQLYIKTKLNLTKSTKLYQGVRKFLSLELCITLLNVRKLLRKEKVDCVILESLFQDRNPLIFLVYQLLVNTARKYNTLIAFSLHEYFRLKKMRFGFYMKMCKYLALKSDILFVTEQPIFDYFTKLIKHVFIRDIPSNIIFPMQLDITKKQRSDFVYFGRVSSDKIFDIMINAWKEFNYDRKYCLHILTSSEISIDSAERYNIYLKKNLSNEQIATEMADKSYCLLPILPFISDNNTTYKTSLCAGCITIGIFNPFFKDMPFNICMDDYSLSSFKSSFAKAIALNNLEFSTACTKAVDFGSKYTYKRTAEQIVSGINEVIKFRSLSL